MGSMCSRQHPGFEDLPPSQQDWAAWERDAKPPKYYDPPQLKASFWGGLKQLNYITHRAPWCATPPCCCAQAVNSCWTGPILGMQFGKLSEPDEWFTKMLKTGSSPNAPKEFQGLWWMRDNIAAEVVVTVHDMNWVSHDLGIKYARYNWTIDAQTIYGACLGVKAHTHRFEVSPNRKWVNIGSPQSWIYVIQPEDKFVRRDGTPVDFVAGEEIMRIEFPKDDSSEGEPAYQYRMQRIAYLDESGKLVKTQFYDELKRRALMSPKTGCCCNHFHNVKDEDYELVFEPLSDWQGVVYAPPPPGAEKAASPGEEKKA